MKRTALARGTKRLTRTALVRDPSPAVKDFAAELDAMRPLVDLRSRGRCEAEASADCRGVAIHVHHRQLRGPRHGGDNSLANLLHVDTICHRFIHDNPALSYERGWLVRTGAEPAEVPVERGMP